MEKKEASSLLQRIKDNRVILTALGLLWLAAAALFMLLPKCSGPGPHYDAELRPPYTDLLSIHHKLGKPRPGNWDPNADPFAQNHRHFHNYSPVWPTKERHTIYIQPIGEVSAEWAQIINTVAQFLSLYYCVKVTRLPALPSTAVPIEASRRHGYSGVQHLSTYITDTLLPKRMPQDALALIALNDFDMWPGGKAGHSVSHTNPKFRTAVWSLLRLGRPEISELDFERALRRTLRLTAHEIGHFLGLDHTTEYLCLMNGSNSLREAENQPLFLSPPALQYLMSFSSCTLEERFNKLGAFFYHYRLAAHARHYKKSLELIE